MKYVHATPDPSAGSLPPFGDVPPSSPYTGAAPYASGTIGPTLSNTGPRREVSSASASLPNPALVKKVPHTPTGVADVDKGVGASSGVRFRSSVYEGGDGRAGDGRLGLMDEGATEMPEDGGDGLMERNLPPLSKKAEEISRGGVEDSWKGRR